jgi:hypothetical protein
MSEPVQLAKTAREHLAAALRALQGSGEVPPALEALAEPIAEAMGVLHRVERSGGADLDGRDTALTNVRSVLDRLQALDGAHPAVDTVMEEVAQSLGKVHALVKYVAPAAPAIPTGTVRMDVPVAPPQPAPAPYAAPQPAPAAYAAPQPAYAAPQAQPYAAPQPAYVAPQAQPAPQPYVAPQAQPAPQPAYVAPQAQPAPQPAYVAPQAQPAYAAPQAQPAPQYRAAPEPPKGAVGVIDVELGTHSPSNFYKGLGGNDVIEHGGIFVATYKVQKLGTNVALRILLPGDYEFQANAVVQWIRAQGGSDEPGFGARFTHITPEGRQLVYRYTRNREPMFYDDL